MSSGEHRGNWWWEQSSEVGWHIRRLVRKWPTLANESEWLAGVWMRERERSGESEGEKNRKRDCGGRFFTLCPSDELQHVKGRIYTIMSLPAANKISSRLLGNVPNRAPVLIIALTARAERRLLESFRKQLASILESSSVSTIFSPSLWLKLHSAVIIMLLCIFWDEVKEVTQHPLILVLSVLVSAATCPSLCPLQLSGWFWSLSCFRCEPLFFFFFLIWRPNVSNSRIIGILQVKETRHWI